MLKRASNAGGCVRACRSLIVGLIGLAVGALIAQQIYELGVDVGQQQQCIGRQVLVLVYRGL